MLLFIQHSFIHENGVSAKLEKKKNKILVPVRKNRATEGSRFHARVTTYTSRSPLTVIHKSLFVSGGAEMEERNFSGRETV